MVVRNCHALADYIKLLERERAEINALFDDVLINVTGFFRDAEVFETLKARIFPEILKTGPQTIRVWVAACSTGQEVYSLAISLLEFLEQKSNAPGIQIFATDLSESISIEKGRRGFYPESIEAEVSPERLRRFFTKEDGGYRISKAIRDLCVFAQQNVTCDPPFSRMDLVSCRNLLIYLTPALQRQVISTFHYALNSSGYLLLGNSETVGANSDLFELLERKHKIYVKKAAAIRPFSHFAALDLKSRTTMSGHTAPVQVSTPADFQREAERILLGRYAPSGVLVNSNLEVLQFRGRTSPYLEPPPGEASFNLLKMARENLSLELGTAIREAKKKNTSVRRNVRLHDDDKIRKVILEILPVKLSGSTESCFLVLFEDAEKGRTASAPRPAKKEIPATEKDRELKQLRAELIAAREYLQTITEQHDAADEELKCANEEALSSNEELQSTNEQLGTAKEELQSSNEELQTLNEELQTRNTELNQLNNDLTNLLASVKIPILMLGNDLRIRRFNSAAAEFLHLKSFVIGRPIHSIESSVNIRDLEQLLLEVIDKVTHKEMEIRDRNGRWFSLRLHPYRTSDNRIDGVILAMVDIDDLKRAHEKLLDHVAVIVDTVRAPLVVLHSDLRVNIVNDAFCQMFRTSKAETENHLIYELGDGQWNIPELRQLLSEMLSSKSILKDFEVAQNFPAIGRRLMLLNARRLEQKAGMPMILLSIEDLTEWKQIEEANRWLAAIVESSQDAIIGKDLNGVIISCNNGASRLFGYETEELIGKHVTILIPPERQHEEVEILGRIRRGEQIKNYETVRRRKDGSLVDLSLTISPVKNIHGKIIGASKIAHDITERRHAETLLRQNESLFAALVDVAPTGVYVIDAQFRLQQINALALPAFAKVEPKIGRDFAEVMEILWGPEVGGEITKIFRHTLATGERYVSPRFSEYRQDLKEE